MNIAKLVRNVSIVLLAFLSLLIIGCGAKKPTAEEVRLSPERSVTIINRTGNNIMEYSLRVANGPEIEKRGSGDIQVIKISENWKNDSTLEIVLLDEYKQIYQNTMVVPLEGKTDVVIEKSHKVSQGAMKDAINNLTEWVNKNK